jgi:hypothetical protein
MGLKIIIILTIVWAITHIFARPNTLFSKWGERVFNSYTTFIMTLFFTFTILIGLTLVYIK